MNLLPLTHAVARMSDLLTDAHKAPNPERLAFALRRIANMAGDIETEAHRLEALAEDERCAEWDLQNGFAVGPRATRINPPKQEAVQ